MVFDWGFRCFSDIEGKITNKSVYAFSFLVGKHREPQSINAKLFLPIIPIGIVAYALTLLWDNLCRSSCIYICGGRGRTRRSRCLQNGVRSVEPDENIFKTGFHFFRSMFDQNTLQEISRTKRKYAQECLRGKKWVLKRCLTFADCRLQTADCRL